MSNSSFSQRFPGPNYYSEPGAGATEDRWNSVPRFNLCTALTAQTPIASVATAMHIFPRVVSRRISVDKIMMQVVGVNAATYRISLWNSVSDTDTFPNLLLEESGAISCATATITALAYTFAAPRILVPGVYWMGYQISAAGPTFLGGGNINFEAVCGYRVAADAIVTQANVAGYTKTHTYGSFADLSPFASPTSAIVAAQVTPVAFFHEG